MNILKAILLTALLMGLEILISLAIYEFIEPKVINSLSDDELSHYFRLIGQIPTIIAYLIVFTITYKTIFNFNKGFKKAKNIKSEFLLYLIFIAIGLELFDRPLFDFSKIYDYFYGIGIEPYKFSESSNLTVLYRGISVLIIAPIFEELFFRKFLFGEVLKKYSLTASILVSSLCFSVIHLPSYRNLLPTFIFGIIACLIYKKTGNIFYTIILHFLTNLSWFLLVTYGKSYYEWNYGLNYNLIYWMSFIIGIGFIYLGLRKITVVNKYK